MAAWLAALDVQPQGAVWQDATVGGDAAGGFAQGGTAAGRGGAG